MTISACQTGVWRAGQADNIKYVHIHYFGMFKIQDVSF